MLFHVTWEFTDQSEESEKRSLAVFTSWQPPAGADFQAFYSFADGSGGVAIIDADSPETLARTAGPFLPWMTFTMTPIVPMDQIPGIAGESITFRDSVQ
jgi:hypothetical protein